MKDSHLSGVRVEVDHFDVVVVAEPVLLPRGRAQLLSHVVTQQLHVNRSLNEENVKMYEVPNSPLFILGGAATCFDGFVICFLKVPLACLGSIAAAVQPNSLGTLRKHFIKPSEQLPSHLIGWIRL